MVINEHAPHCVTTLHRGPSSSTHKKLHCATENHSVCVRFDENRYIIQPQENTKAKQHLHIYATAMVPLTVQWPIPYKVT